MDVEEQPIARFEAFPLIRTLSRGQTRWFTLAGLSDLRRIGEDSCTKEQRRCFRAHAPAFANVRVHCRQAARSHSAGPPNNLLGASNGRAPPTTCRARMCLQPAKRRWGI